MEALKGAIVLAVLERLCLTRNTNCAAACAAHALALR